jgi:hypothetical protein
VRLRLMKSARSVRCSRGAERANKRSSLDMNTVTTVVTGLDGTTGSGNYTYTCPEASMDCTTTSAPWLNSDPAG